MNTSTTPISIWPYSTVDGKQAKPLSLIAPARGYLGQDRSASEITYSFRGTIRKFRPDYLVRLANHKMLVPELKGQDNQEQQRKRELLREWVRTVNRHGEFCA